jgi:cellobiose phosphorylase
MKLENRLEKIIIASDGIRFEVLPTGDLHGIFYHNESISMYRANMLDGMLANIYLRVTKDGKTSATKLLGVDSPSAFRIAGEQMLYVGEFSGVRYSVHFKLSGLHWFWTVRLEGGAGTQAELFSGQDVSLNSPFANEAYVCQYLDHRAERFDGAYHVRTKQNQGPPLILQQGSLTPNCAYCTDGFDFFGKEYKKDNSIKALQTGSLPSRVYQYEFAYVSFQTPKTELSKPYEAIFYAALNPDWQASGDNWLKTDELKKIYDSVPEETDYERYPQIKHRISFQNTLPHLPFTDSELDEFFPEKLFLEEENGKKLSWFSETGTHYVTGEKELLLERPHGNIITNQGMRDPEIPGLASTNYIFGVFNSHLSLGNIQFNRMLSRNKTPLNALKTSGQRVFVKQGGKYRLLALPAVYEMHFNASAWHYKIDGDVLKIEAGVPAHETYARLEISSKLGRHYDLLLTNELAMGEAEYLHPINLSFDGESAILAFDESTMAGSRHPEYRFRMEIETDGEWRYSGDEVFFEDGKTRRHPLLCVEIEGASKFSCTIFGLTTAQKPAAKPIKEMKEEYLALHRENTGGFRLEMDPENKASREIEKFNILVPWYLHNALIHFAMPHGLEQYGGGAWGTRDVCQGPAELFTAFGRFDLIKKIILKVYERQFHETGDWPQWFMFDAFRHIQADSSHGDIIVWPLYLLANYMLHTGDREILKEVIPYTTLTGERVHPESIRGHVKRQLGTIKANFIPGTHLSGYGGGDWDDTLQPVRDELRTTMASSWTVALTIEALETFLFSCDEEEDLRELVENIKKDYCKYFLKDGIPAGFVQMDGEGVRHIVHPSDSMTGIKYRLLSFSRGIISEIFPEECIESYLEIINQHLLHPDGVRLMDRTVKYRGGLPKTFVRAETATNFGREIGLLYVHAHIRYLEAMAKIGAAEKLYQGLKVVNPILIRENVKNALPRQSNVYFSSSDGAFLTRYQADREFEKLRTGDVAVKGGWRLYSSGPGIYLRQLICSFLGINFLDNQLYIDPVLPKSLDGLKLSFRYKNHELNITYEITDEAGAEAAIVNGKEIPRNTNLRKYRRSGVLIPDGILKDKNEIILKM